MIYYIKEFSFYPMRISSGKWIWFSDYYYTWVPPSYDTTCITLNLNLLEDTINSWILNPPSEKMEDLFDDWTKIKISSNEYLFLRLAGKAVLQHEWNP